MAKDIKDLNRATVEDLEGIQGIGRDRAEDIISYRNEHGSFSDWDDLKEIPGFDEGMIQSIHDGEWGESSGAEDDTDEGEDEEEKESSDTEE